MHILQLIPLCSLTMILELIDNSADESILQLNNNYVANRQFYSYAFNSMIYFSNNEF